MGLKAPRKDVAIGLVVVGDEDQRRLTHNHPSVGKYSRTLARSWRGLNGLAT